MVDNSGSTSRSIISCLGPEIFVQMNLILTKFCPWKLGVPVIMTHRVDQFGDVLPSQSLGLALKKLNLTQQKETTQEQNSLS